MFGQNPLKDVDSRVLTRMLRKDGSITISLRNFVGEGIINHVLMGLFQKMHNTILN
jgi:carbamoylphosphate synthase small subunit